MAKKKTTPYVAPTQPEEIVTEETSTVEETVVEDTGEEVTEPVEETVDEVIEEEVAAEVVTEEPAVEETVEEPIVEPTQVEEPTKPESLDDVEVEGTYTTAVEETNAPEVVERCLLTEVRQFLGEPVNFPVKMCEEILKTRVIPERTLRGHWLVDTQRERNMDKWSIELIRDFIDGHIVLSSEEVTSLAWKYIYQRYTLAPGTYRDEAIKYIVDHVEPQKTSSGLLVNDSVRESLAIEHWTYSDLRAALKGEINHSFNDDTLVKRLREVSGVSEKFDAETLVKTTIDKEYGTMTHHILESRLEQYKKVRHGAGRQSLQVIGENNAQLLREIRRQLNQEYPVFAEGWKILLNFVKKEMNTLFNDSVRYEGWKQVPLQANDLRALEDVLTLLVMSVEDDNRQHGLPVSTVRELTLHLTTEENQQKLLTFYQR